MLFPEWLQTALLVILLGLVIYKTAGKGFKQWKQEQKARGAAAPEARPPRLGQEGCAQAAAPVLLVAAATLHTCGDEGNAALALGRCMGPSVMRVQQGTRGLHVISQRCWFGTQGFKAN